MMRRIGNGLIRRNVTDFIYDSRYVSTKRRSNFSRWPPNVEFPHLYVDDIDDDDDDFLRF